MIKYKLITIPIFNRRKKVHMKAYEEYIRHISKNNCNGRLSYLYKVRDNISEEISMMKCKGIDTSTKEKQYNDLIDVIEELCKFRRNSPGCLIEGDTGFRYF